MPIYFLLALSVLFWSGNFIFGRYAHDAIDPLTLNLFRWGTVALILLPYIYSKRDIITKAMKKDFGILLLLAALGIAGFNTALYTGLQYTSATNALLINSSIPVLIVLFNSEKITLRQMVGILFSTVGVIYLVLKGEVNNLTELNFNQGDLWIIITSIIWALYSILIKKRPTYLSSFEFLATISMLGFGLLLLSFYLFGHHLSYKTFYFDSEIYSIILYMAIFPSLLSFYFWNRGLVEIGANKTGQFTHLMPIFGAILAVVFLGEEIHFYHFVGMCLIGFGIYLSIFLGKTST